MCLAVPGQIVSIAPMQSDDADLFRSGKVRFGGVVKTISLACVPNAQVDDYVIVHVGMAIAVLDEAEALQTIADLEEMNR